MQPSERVVISYQYVGSGNERTEEAAKFDQTWRGLIEDAEKKAAAKVLEVTPTGAARGAR